MPRRPGSIVAYAVAAASLLAACSSPVPVSPALPVPAAGAPAPAAPPRFSFVQMADTQLGLAATPLVLAYFGWGGRQHRFAWEARQFERAVTAVHALEPAFVVVCGDLVNSWGHTGQTAEFLRVRATVRAGIPVHLVPGNHDVGNRPTVESLAWYRSTFGKDRYAFRHDGLYGIVLNSSLLTRPDEVPDEAAAQHAWLEAELATAAAARARHIVVFTHHPLFVAHPDERDTYFNVPRERRRPLLELFARHGVRAVFAGHYHRNALARAGELEMVTTGPVGLPLGDDPSGFRVVHVYGDRLEHAYHSIDPPGS